MKKTQGYNTVGEQVATTQYEKIEDPLLKAQALIYPSRESILERHPSVQEFWNTHNNLLINAWQEWDEKNKNTLRFSTEKLLDIKLREAIHKAWKNPLSESDVRDLLTEESQEYFSFRCLM